ncbi:helix-turn-helix domain-containing protein [Vibrio parahaemolyticus]|uniref:helix-turn-helix domain-containing protein n=1 Tax=Vibrio parahaemolyticus TaxID=670 RepID=UPI000A961F79
METPLRKCRLDEGISLITLASDCDTSLSTLSRLERGVSINASASICHFILERYQHCGLTLEHLVYPKRFPNFSIKRSHTPLVSKKLK